MTWKIYHFNCGCKYFTTFFPRSSGGNRVCPEHGQTIYEIIKSCATPDCENIMHLKALKGKRKWCEVCRKRKERKINKDAAAKRRAAKRELKKAPKVIKKPIDPEKIIAEKAINAWYQAMREMFKPVWGGGLYERTVYKLESEQGL